jgi:hypothetical protein
MKKDVINYVSTYLTCQKVKAEYKKVDGFTLTNACARMEVGRDNNGFCHWIASDSKQKGCYLGCSRQIHKVSTFHTRECKRFNANVSKNLYSRSGQVTWGTFNIVSDQDPRFTSRF